MFKTELHHPMEETHFDRFLQVYTHVEWGRGVPRLPTRCKTKMIDISLCTPLFFVLFQQVLQGAVAL